MDVKVDYCVVGFSIYFNFFDVQGVDGEDIVVGFVFWWCCVVVVCFIKIGVGLNGFFWQFCLIGIGFLWQDVGIGWQVSDYLVLLVGVGWCIWIVVGYYKVFGFCGYIILYQMW